MNAPERTDDLRLAIVIAAALAALALPAAVRAPVAGQRRERPPLAVEAHRVQVNGARAGELRALPGVGAVLAERIVAERRRAPFTSVADLRRVRGIGPFLAGRVAPHVSFRPRGPGDGPRSRR